MVARWCFKKSIFFSFFRYLTSFRYLFISLFQNNTHPNNIRKRTSWNSWTKRDVVIINFVSIQWNWVQLKTTYSNLRTHPLGYTFIYCIANKIEHQCAADRVYLWPINMCFSVSICVFLFGMWAHIRITIANTHLRTNAHKAILRTSARSKQQLYVQPIWLFIVIIRQHCVWCVI